MTEDWERGGCQLICMWRNQVGFKGLFQFTQLSEGVILFALGQGKIREMCPYKVSIT